MFDREPGARSSRRTRGLFATHLAALLLLVLTAGCRPPQSEDEKAERERAEAAERVIARIDGAPITVGDLQTSITEQPVFVRSSIRGETAYLRHFAELLNFRLLVAEARRRELAADPDVQLAVRQALADAYWAEPALWSQLPQLGEDEIEAAWQARSATYREPSRVELLLVERSGGTAAAGHFLLAATVARAARAGALSPVADDVELLRALGAQSTGLVAASDATLDDAQRALVDAVLADAQDASGPRTHVAGDRAFVYMVLQRVEGGALSFDAARTQLVQDLLAERRAAERTELVERWREQASIRIVDEKVRGLVQ